MQGEMVYSSWTGGDDTLSGGSGADVFVFQTAGYNGLDTIRDFDPAVDTFRIETGNLDFDTDNVWYEMCFRLKL